MLVELLDRLRQAAAADGTRALLVVETRPDGPAAVPESTPGPATRPDRADRLGARLGTENALLVHDARARLDPAMLAAEAGTIPAGGALVLVMSPMMTTPSRFHARFVGRLREYLATETSTAARITLSQATAAALPDTLAMPLRTLARPRDAPCPAPAPSTRNLASQQALLDRARRRLARDADALIVIEAPRGHGKSALLGRLAATLDDDGIAYAICAARRAGVDVLERHRRAASPASRTPLPFLPPDVAQASEGDVLLVDEAASLPLPVLQDLFGRWRRLVLATTTGGYEVAGRAFALQLPGILDRSRPGWLRLAPPEPLRWRSGDPLDGLLARIALTNTSLADPSDDALAALPELSAARVARITLADDEDRLASLHGLLATTHYQSTPLDLAHLLDAPALAVWTVEHAGQVLGAALVARESGTERALHADVVARRRRLPHRLLPQLLAQSANRADALEARYARVVRIAVHPAVRRRGIARRLVERMIDDNAAGDTKEGARDGARDDTIDVEAFGASFGETPVTRAFWSSLGFVPFHRGYRRNPRSGQRSLAVLRAMSPRTREVLATAAAIHRDNERVERAATASVDTPPVGMSSTDMSPTDAPPVAASSDTTTVGTRDHDDELLRRFADGERTFSDTRAALHRLVATAANPTNPNAGHRPLDTEHALSQACGVSAALPRREREARVRERMGALVQRRERR